MPDNNQQPNKQPSPISNLKLKISYWYVTNKLQLRKGLVVSLVILSFIFYSYSIYRVSMILLVEDKTTNRGLAYLTADFIDYEYFHEANKPKNLQILGFEGVDGREGKYDFVAKVNNPNDKWVASEVVFQLMSGEEIIAEKTSFVFPNEEKYIEMFGQEIVGSTPGLKIAKVVWRRHLEFENFSLPRLKFEISDIEFKSSRESGIRGELPVSILNFKMANNSGYNYWTVGVHMVLLSGSKMVGANYLALEQFRSEETREIEMRWYEPLPSNVQIEILPEVNILDPTTYMPVE